MKLTDLLAGPLFVIAGPCVIESEELCLQVGAHVQEICAKLGLPYVFKASFDKANRSSGDTFRGPGLEEGLQILSRVKQKLGVALLSDIHEASQAQPAGEVLDVLQVPAFLARQTDLLLACGNTQKIVNVKKGQFMSPSEMNNAVAKLKSTGNEQILLTERGTFFGYNRLVNDFTSLPVMAETGCPIVFDITHSTQQPGGQGTSSGGNPQYAPMLARAAMSTGVVNGLFLECHPRPREAKSDAATMLGLDVVEPLLRQCLRLREVMMTIQ